MAQGYGITFNESQSATAVPDVIFTSVRRPFRATVRDEYVEVPGRESSWLFTQPAGDGEIEIDFIIVASSNADRRAAVRSLAAWTRTPTRAPMVIDDETDRFWWAKLDSESGISEAINLGRGTLNFRCLPYAEAVSTSEETSSATTHTFNVSGDANIEMLPVIEITMTAGAASGVEMEINGTVLGTREALVVSDVRTFSCLSATVTEGANADDEFIAGGYANDTLAMADVYGDFPPLFAGSNTVEATRGAFDQRVVWRRRYS